MAGLGALGGLLLLPAAIGLLLLSSLGQAHRTARAVPSPLPSASATCLAGLCVPAVTPLPSLLPLLPSPSLPALLVSPRPLPTLPRPVSPAVGRAPGFWPMIGYDSAHAGANPADALVNAGNIAQLKFAWSDGGGYGLPAIAGGHVEYPDGGFVASFADPSDCGVDPYHACTQQWRMSRDGGDGADGLESVAVVGGQLIVPDSRGSVYVFSSRPCGATHCLPLWSGTTVGGVGRVIAVDGGNFFVGTGDQFNGSQRDQRVYAFPLAGCGGPKCAPLWTSKADNTSDIGGVSVGAGRVYAADGYLRAYSSAGCGASTCAPLWTSAYLAYSVPVFDAGTIYGTGADLQFASTTLFAADAATGALRWSVAVTGKSSGGSLGSHPTVAGGRVFVGGPDGRLRAFDAATGAALWSAPTGKVGDVAPVVADGLVFASLPLDGGGIGGGLAAYAAAGCGAVTCAPLWVGHSPTGTGPETVAAVTAGRVYGASSGIVEVFALPGR